MIALELQFLGGASEVGRSAVLLNGSKRVLLDYGVKLNGKTKFPLQAGNIDACVLSHAHLDHSGDAPSLYRTHFPVTYGTAPTKELSELLILDSVKIAKKNHQAQRFSKSQVRAFLNKYSALEFGSEIRVGDYSITLHDAGHISGSAMVLIENRRNGKRLLYTGDFKLEPQILQEGAEILKSDILVTESTYADREHPDRESLIRRFVGELREVLDNGGTALVPVFAVGRAQEVIAMLYKNNLLDCAYMDGMARKATEITMRHPEFIKNKDILQSAIKKIMWIGSDQKRGDATSGPGIIVTTAGMLNGGPVLDYITKLNPKSKIFLTGYQVEGTNGRRLLEHKPINLNGNKQLIKTPFVFYDFSAHTGKSGLYRCVKESNPEVVVCVHGEMSVADEFAENLRMEGFKAHSPRFGETIKLDF